MIIVFLGPPGSGKGTQAQLLGTGYRFYHFDTGSLLRSEAASGSELGKRIATYIEAGNLVPLAVIEDLLAAFLKQTTADRIMFDGFPRSLEQAQVLTTQLATQQLSLTHVIYLEMEQDALLARIANRRSCEFCGTIYNIATNPPVGPCPAGHPACSLVQRKDDNPAVFMQRLNVYLAETMPVLDYYLELGLLRRVDGNQPIDKVGEGILRILDLHS